jgi:hypothetical protein
VVQCNLEEKCLTIICLPPKIMLRVKRAQKPLGRAPSPAGKDAGVSLSEDGWDTAIAAAGAAAVGGGRKASIIWNQYMLLLC